MRIAVLLALAVAVAAPAAGAQRDAMTDSLRARIARRVLAVPGAHVAVAYRELDGRDSLDVGADAPFHAASTMKVPVMIELFRRHDRGGLSLEQPVLLVNRFRSIADGSPYAVSPRDDSDSAMYARIGERVPVRELIERMIVRSSNLATNALVALADPERVTATARLLGAPRTRVLRGVEDQKAYDAGMINTTTAADLATLLEGVETRSAASAESCDEMRAILLRQQFNDEIPAGVPQGIPVAHKTGSITGVLHDAAIVYPQRRNPYALVVMTRDIADERAARTLIVDISRLVWDHSAARHGLGAAHAAVGAS